MVRLFCVSIPYVGAGGPGANGADVPLIPQAVSGRGSHGDLPAVYPVRLVSRFFTHIERGGEEDYV